MDAGRDQRLAPVHASTQLGIIQFFREARQSLERNVEPIQPLFDGPLATDELVEMVASSGLEPLAFANYILNDLGAGTKSAHASELCGLLFALHLMVAVDRLNLPRLASADHLSRWTLHLLKAISKSPRQPDFEGLSWYTWGLPWWVCVLFSSIATPQSSRRTKLIS